VTILQLHAQSAGVPVPPQLLAALPYLITVAVLVVIMRARRSGAGGGAAGPQSLGVPFVADR
jgi:simple sugar transport system permease protein